MRTTLPSIAIIDWKSSPLGERACSVEKKVAGAGVQVSYQLADRAEDLDERTRQAKALVLWHNLPLAAKELAKLPKCRVIVRNGVGYDSIDLPAAREQGIAVCNVPDYGTEEVADHAIALALTLCRQIFALNESAKRLEWKITAAEKLRRFSAMKFGVVGLGPIGTATALRAKNLGFQVTAYDPFVPRGIEKALGIERVTDLDQLLKTADLLSLHCPLNKSTHHLIKEREFKLMKPTAFIVNTSRGALIEKKALLRALHEGRLAGAGLDVIEDEPLRSRSEAETPNLIATCHAAFCSIESKIELRTSSTRIALAAITEGKFENCVNAA